MKAKETEVAQDYCYWQKRSRVKLSSCIGMSILQSFQEEANRTAESFMHDMSL